MESPSISDETIEKLIRQGIPGFDADWIRRTKAQMNQVKPLQRKRRNPALSKASLAKIEYVYLVQIINQKAPERTPLLSKEDSVMKIPEVEAFLIDKKLVEKVGNEFAVTELGKRFMWDFEQREKTEK